MPYMPYDNHFTAVNPAYGEDTLQAQLAISVMNDVELRVRGEATRFRCLSHPCPAGGTPRVRGRHSFSNPLIRRRSFDSKIVTEHCVR